MSEWFQNVRSEFEDKDYAHDYADELLYAYIATQLKVLRQQQKLTQQELADRAGMKQERISVLEDVNYSSWTISTLLKLARAFDVRLKVSFENFSTVLNDMLKLSPESLQRTKREDDLGLAPTANYQNEAPFLRFLDGATTEQKPSVSELVKTLPENLNPLTALNSQMEQVIHGEMRA